MTLQLKYILRIKQCDSLGLSLHFKPNLQSVVFSLKCAFYTEGCQNLNRELRNHDGSAGRRKTSLQNISLNFLKYFMIIPSCLYYTIWSKFPIIRCILFDSSLDLFLSVLHPIH